MALGLVAVDVIWGLFLTFGFSFAVLLLRCTVIVLCCRQLGQASSPAPCLGLRCGCRIRCGTMGRSLTNRVLFDFVDKLSVFLAYISVIFLLIFPGSFGVEIKVLSRG